MARLKRDPRTGSYARSAAPRQKNNGPRQAPQQLDHEARYNGGQPSARERYDAERDRRNDAIRLNAAIAKGTRQEAAQLQSWYGDTTPKAKPTLPVKSAATTYEDGRED
ncbi:MAG: hypothetical protein AAF583_08115 [Pseudomonadota bacterium]